MPYSQLQSLACGLGMLLLMAGVQPGEWSTSDKTNVDLESARSATATHYMHPRGAQRYRHDETEVDLAIPLPASQPPQVAPDLTPAEATETVPDREEEFPQ